MTPRQSCALAESMVGVVTPPLGSGLWRPEQQLALLTAVAFMRDERPTDAERLVARAVRDLMTYAPEVWSHTETECDEDFPFSTMTCMKCGAKPIRAGTGHCRTCLGDLCDRLPTAEPQP